MLQGADKFHKTRRGYLVFSLVEAVLAIVFMALAIGHGNILWYLLTLIMLIGFLQNFFKFANTFAHKGRDE